jgi:2-polyprenyl-6-methoxyphenol hydroxylase-like FAD-dependent oxidoreductase
VIPKGGIEEVRARGLEAFRADMVKVVPLFAGRIDTLASWDDIKLLSVTVDRLERWYKPGLLCIGDAAHAMSPVGGVGINLAVQDAVAAANILAAALADARRGKADFTPLLAQVEKRRLLPPASRRRRRWPFRTGCSARYWQAGAATPRPWSRPGR